MGYSAYSFQRESRAKIGRRRTESPPIFRAIAMSRGRRFGWANYLLSPWGAGTLIGKAVPSRTRQSSRTASSGFDFVTAKRLQVLATDACPWLERQKDDRSRKATAGIGLTSEADTSVAVAVRPRFCCKHDLRPEGGTAVRCSRLVCPSMTDYDNRKVATGR